MGGIDQLIEELERSYTEARQVEATGATLGELLADLERQFPGMRFRVIDEQDRMRAHMRFFVNGEQTFDLKRPLKWDPVNEEFPGDEEANRFLDRAKREPWTLS